MNAFIDAHLERFGVELVCQNYEAYGYRRMWKALLRSRERVGRGHVQRLMAAEGIQGAKRRGRRVGRRRL